MCVWCKSSKNIMGFGITVFCLLSTPEIMVFAQNVIALCEKVSPPKNLNYIENCSLVCSTAFQQHLINAKRDDIALCSENGTAIACKSNSDCHKYHLGASCKKLPCMCKGKPGSRLLYVLDSHTDLKIPSMDTCVVSTKWMSPELPLVPFPWGTLLVVFAIVASFVVCLLAVRWISPIIRRMQAKSITRNRRASAGEEGSLFTSVPLQENLVLPSFLPHRNPRICVTAPQAHIIRAAQRRMIHNRALRDDVADSDNVCALSPDKPPPYELAVQEEPPSYNELEEPLNTRQEENSENARRSSESESRVPLRPAESAASISTI